MLGLPWYLTRGFFKILKTNMPKGRDSYLHCSFRQRSLGNQIVGCVECGKMHRYLQILNTFMRHNCQHVNGISVVMSHNLAKASCIYIIQILEMTQRNSPLNNRYLYMQAGEFFHDILFI
jgi:hypothetical protein